MHGLWPFATGRDSSRTEGIGTGWSQRVIRPVHREQRAEPLFTFSADSGRVSQEPYVVDFCR